jgi:hypothetical protein
MRAFVFPGPNGVCLTVKLLFQNAKHGFSPLLARVLQTDSPEGKAKITELPSGYGGKAIRSSLACPLCPDF